MWLSYYWKYRDFYSQLVLAIVSPWNYQKVGRLSMSVVAKIFQADSLILYECKPRTKIGRCLETRLWYRYINITISDSLVPRTSTAPVIDCLQQPSQFLHAAGNQNRSWERPRNRGCIVTHSKIVATIVNIVNGFNSSFSILTFTIIWLNQSVIWI